MGDDTLDEGKEIDGWCNCLIVGALGANFPPVRYITSTVPLLNAVHLVMMSAEGSRPGISEPKAHEEGIDKESDSFDLVPRATGHFHARG